MTSRVHRKKKISKKRRNQLKNGKNSGEYNFEIVFTLTSPCVHQRPFLISSSIVDGIMVSSEYALSTRVLSSSAFLASE